jgi:hypothetical protein
MYVHVLDVHVDCVNKVVGDDCCIWWEHVFSRCGLR